MVPGRRSVDSLRTSRTLFWIMEARRRYVYNETRTHGMPPARTLCQRALVQAAVSQCSAESVWCLSRVQAMENLDAAEVLAGGFSHERFWDVVLGVRCPRDGQANCTMRNG